MFIFGIQKNKSKNNVKEKIIITNLISSPGTKIRGASSLCFVLLSRGQPCSGVLSEDLTFLARWQKNNVIGKIKMFQANKSAQGSQANSEQDEIR